ncbi:MAG: NAD-dependent malic enzyme [Gammaproteobacteria bacterium]|nr:NAD-dependent malic enzyme [Gammaproteobacteria bacterium]
MKSIFKLNFDPKTGEKFLETRLTGKSLLNSGVLNKGTAFTQKEREEFKILGKLPSHVETLEEQVKRSYDQLQRYANNLNKSIYLNSVLNQNETLFYKLCSLHIEELLPVIYTPIVGTAVQKYSSEFRAPRGLYISYPDRHRIPELLANRTHPEIDIIVASDGERVLGIGDQGVGGMDITIAKLMVYTICGGVFPGYTLPILLDVGTDNENLLNDPMYLGWRSKRIRGQEYDEFIDSFVTAVKKNIPNVFLHWEDFGRDNARKILDNYTDKICSFNDDIQGTGAVACATVLAGVKTNKQKITEQKIVIFGAGSAGVGIADQLYRVMLSEGLSSEEALAKFWLIDRNGLLLDTSPDLIFFQKPYCRHSSEVANWKCREKRHIGLLEVIENIKPTVLIGCSAVSGAFSEKVVTTMQDNLQAENIRPIILPLSNPPERCEASPKDLVTWTDGKALIATGSPFQPIIYNNKTYEIAQSNNALIFPGIGLGVCAIKATKVTDNMIWAACEILSDHAPILNDQTAPLLPRLKDAHWISEKIGIAVAQQAVKDRVAEQLSDQEIVASIKRKIWTPEYLPIKLV